MSSSTPPTFLSIPPEIRNKIYYILLTGDTSILISSLGQTFWSDMTKTSNKLPAYFTSILYVNKQINGEAKTIFYALNTFRECF